LPIEIPGELSERERNNAEHDPVEYEETSLSFEFKSSFGPGWKLRFQKLFSSFLSIDLSG
jgi:hypothetical protein